MSSGRLQEVKTRKIIIPSPQKVVAVAYERSNYRVLTGKNLVFWMGGRL